MRRRVAQDIQSVGTVDGDPFQETILLDRSIQIDGTTVNLGGDNVTINPMTRPDFVNPGTAANLHGLAVGQSYVNVFHPNVLAKNGRHGQD